MKKAKLQDYYSDWLKEDVKKYLISASQLKKPLLAAAADKVDELEITQEEFICTLEFGIANNLYYHTIYDGGHYHSVLGMKLIIT